MLKRACQVCLGCDGTVWTWGEKSSGQLGIREGPETGDMRQVVSLRKEALIGDRVVQAVAGGSHTLLVTASGAVLAFGSNIKVHHDDRFDRVIAHDALQGQLGVGEKSDTDDDDKRGQLQRALLPAGMRVTMCAGGGIHSVAVTACGRVLAWGYNGQGQLGLGAAAGEECLAPHAVALPGGAAAAAMAAAGFGHTVVLTADGAVYAFGCGDQGQLGLGRRENVFEPARVDALAGQRVRCRLLDRLARSPFPPPSPGPPPPLQSCPCPFATAMSA